MARVARGVTTRARTQKEKVVVEVPGSRELMPVAGCMVGRSLILSQVLKNHL